MAAKAFVLIEIETGKTKEVVANIKQLKGVKSVDAVTGPYDVIAIVESGSLNEIGDVVTSKLHKTAGISRTVTCLAISTD